MTDPQAEARAALADIVKRHGLGLARDARRCEALLHDNVPGLRRETNLLVAVVKEGVAASLAAPPAGLAPDLLVNQGTQRLTDALAMQPEAARWAVESWALAIGGPALEPTVAAAPAAGQDDAWIDPAAPAAVEPVAPPAPPQEYVMSDEAAGALMFALLVPSYFAAKYGVAWAGLTLGSGALFGVTCLVWFAVMCCLAIMGSSTNQAK